MIKAGEVTKQPSKAVWYMLTKMELLLTIATVPLTFVSKAGGFSAWLLLNLLVGLPILIYILLDNKAVSFVIDKNKIDINWGILFKKSKTIMAKSIQNIKIERGLLIRFFGLSVVKIWTASPGQIDNRDRENPNKPDGLLVILREDGEMLKGYWAK